ncbi:MAG: glycosyltransferase family 9 protein [Aphanothece sp. CMT-3BRIN-NPC111]|jgi:ADP-heptose:LPS heptosyltransferase|nr:glycosyltransferase family 9 protein [Aphanothece sp. CMT-3BRIN-NPC111]
MLEAKNPVALFANAIGDHILALPAFRALVKLFPKRLTLICTPSFKQTFFPEFCHDITCIPEFYWNGKKWEFDIEAVANQLERCDLLLWLSTWYPPNPEHILKLLSPNYSIGFCPGFDINIPPDFNKHMADLIFDVPLQLSANLRLEDFAYPPVFRTANQQRAREIRNLISEPMKVMVVHADTKPQKMWPADNFRVLVDLFLERHPEFVVFVVGSHNLRLNAEQYGKRIFLYNKRLALATSLALVGEADLFLGVDSCMLHAADLFRVPGVGLFGPTSCVEWGFRFSRHAHICTEGEMEKIQVDEVLEALETLVVNGLSQTTIV